MIVGYHGTLKSCAGSILEEGFQQSNGDRQWLGDGIYFWTEIEYAYKWNYDHCKSLLPKPNVEILRGLLVSDYSILESLIDDTKAFDLDKPDHKMAFDDIVERSSSYLEKVVEKKKKIPLECAILNVMFSKDEYRNEFDLGIASFIKMNNNVYGKYGNKFRLKYSIRKQVCVKNIQAIKESFICDITNKESYFHSIVNKL